MVAGTSPAASSATAGSTHSIGLTGLTPATQYSIYCATPHDVVSTVLTAYASGFSSQPTKSNDNAGTTVTVAESSGICNRHHNKINMSTKNSVATSTTVKMPLY